MNNYQNLVVWQKADELAFQVYRISKGFPREELYGITSQVRRAALSIPTNLAEGAGRQSKNETKQFANIALGSLSELEYLLHFCKRLRFLNDIDYCTIMDIRKDVGALLWKFHKSMAN